MKSIPVEMSISSEQFIGNAETDQTKWSCTIKKLKLSHIDNLIQLQVKFRVVTGNLKSAGVALAIDFNEWSQENQVLIPGAAYNGNRFRSLALDYPPTIYHPDTVLINPELTITDVPRLNNGVGLSKLELTSGDAATPAVGIFSPAKKYGFIVLTEQETRLGNYGIIIEESDNRRHASLS